VCPQLRLKKLCVSPIAPQLRPITQVPVLPVETQSALFANCDPQHVWKHAEQWIDSAMGPSAVAAIRREAQMLGCNFETEFLSSWNGFFGNLQFGPRPIDASPTINEPSQHDRFGDFCVIAGVAKKKEALSPLPRRLCFVVTTPVIIRNPISSLRSKSVFDREPFRIGSKLSQSEKHKQPSRESRRFCVKYHVFASFLLIAAPPGVSSCQVSVLDR